MRSRRDFIRLGALGTAGLGLSPVLGLGAGAAAPLDRAIRSTGADDRSLRVLILGGTSFLGPAQVEYLLDRGHEVTLFNRGRTNPGLFPGVEKLRGDRATGELEALKGREWDAVIDNSATVPRWAKESAELLKDHAGTYLYVSSISVYADTSIVGMTEDAPVLSLEDPTVEEITGALYGGAKATCEQHVRDAFGEDRAIVVRPGLIVGPRDGTDRFTYWPVRVRRGGEILCPGNPTDPVQFIDVRDLGEFMVRLSMEGRAGTYHATGPFRRPMQIAEMIYGVRACTTAETTFTWVDTEFLTAQEVRPWQDMPVWIPPVEGMEGFSQVDCSRAVGAGLTFRPLAETVQATLEWVDTWPRERAEAPLRFGIAPEREAEILAAWHGREG